MSEKDDLDSSESVVDRRAVERTNILKGALLSFSKKADVHSCTVRDITNLGAGFRAQNLQIMPLDFELSFGALQALNKANPAPALARRAKPARSYMIVK